MKASEWNRVASDYYQEISSPFQEGVENPIFESVEAIDDKERKDVIDLGCGTGPLLPFLSGMFNQVIGVDFSSKMVEISKNVSVDLSNVEVLKKDLRDLREFQNKFDVAVSVNSIIMPDLADIDRSFSQIFNSLKPGGIFLGIFPSIESDIYRAMLTYEREISKVSKKKAEKNVDEIIDPTGYNFLLGYYENEGLQKHFYRFELKYRLEKAGFKNIEISRVRYPWESCSDDDIEYFKDKDKLWDWFISARA